MVVHDDPIPGDLAERMRKGLLMLDLEALHEKDRPTALVAALWSAQHAAALGDDVLSHVRSQLIALATVRGRESPQPSQNDVEEIRTDVVVGCYVSLLQVGFEWRRWALCRNWRAT